MNSNSKLAREMRRRRAILVAKTAEDIMSYVLQRCVGRIQASATEIECFISVAATRAVDQDRRMRARSR